MARQKYPSDEADKFLLRLPGGMRQRIADRARGNLRSMNSEVLLILASALGENIQSTAGQSLQANAPAADHDTASQGGPVTHGR